MMKLFKFLPIVFFALFGTLVLNAQEEGSLTGNLYYQKEETVPFATVAMMKLPDSIVVTGTTTDLEGIFELDAPEKGKYLLRFSAIGFKTTFTEPFEIQTEGYNRDFGRVVLPAEVTMLNEVMVQAWRPRIELEAGKMVVRMAGTAMAAGSTAFEILSKSPGVMADHDGNLQLNGKSGVEVMINGRQTYLSSDELKTMLESMPAENIENIELIHSPSAKYPAAGTAGLINIVLKENVSLGLNGTVYGGVEFNEENWYNAGLNLNYNKGKWNTFLSADLTKSGFMREQEMNRTFTTESEYDYFRQVGDQLDKRWIPSFRAGIDYDLNSRHSIGAMANYSFYDEAGKWDTETALGNFSEGDLLNISARNRMDEDYENARYNFHYIGKLDTIGTTITADVDYVELNKDLDSDFTNHYRYLAENIEETEHLFSQSISAYNILAAKANLSLPLDEKSVFALGVKGSRVISESDLQFYLGENENQELDESRSNSFKYEEQIYAAYASYSNKLSDTWNLQLGLRAEKTLGEGISPTTGENNEKDYLNFFPNIQISQKVSENYELQYLYTKRIKRPNYSTFNPFLFYLDPYTYIVGNPELDAEITSSYKVTQNLYGKYQLMLGYDHTEGPMGEYPKYDPETGHTILTTANLDKKTSFSATLVVPLEIGSFWNINNTLIANKTNYDIYYDGELIENDNFHYSIQSNHQIMLPWDVKMELIGSYMGPVNAGIYSLKSRWFLDAGLKRSFLDDRLDVTLKATDIFKGMKMTVNAAYPGSTFRINQYFYDQSFSLNLRYKLFSSEAKKKTRQDSFEELNRAGG